MSASTVQLINFSKFRSGTPEEQQDVASQIDLAFRTTGFVQLKNHGIPKTRVQECFDWSAKFFALPTATKLLAPHPPGGSHHRGYSGLSTEKVTQHVFDDAEIDQARQIPDVKESFESGNVSDENQPNIWPPDDVLPGFRDFMEGFFEDCAALIHTLLHALSLALHLPSTLNLPATHARSLFQLRLLHYPPLARADLEKRLASRIGAHSDFGTLTLLFQDEVGGLEIETPDEEEPGAVEEEGKGEGRFVPVPPVGERGETVLVNVGDLMARWSNDRWKSTVHRVVAPPAGKGDGEEVCPARYSIPFFATADDDAVIEARPGCWGEGRAKKYERVTAREYVRMRMAALY